MARHVPPHRWADADAGKLSTDELARAEAHVRDCDACAAARDRVRASQLALIDIAESEPDDLRWDEIGARIYWSRSHERRRAGVTPRRVWAYGAAAAALAAGGIVAYLALGGDGATRDRTVAPAPQQPAPTVEPMPDPDPLMGVVTVAAGEVTVDGAPLEFDGIVLAGQTLVTGDGARVTVQFGADSAFTLGENATLAVAEFDLARVQLDVTGTVDVRVSHRAPDQRFAVVAGDRRVVVRGTVFRVDHRADALEIVCTDGRVAVHEGDRVTEVSAGERLRVLDVLAASGAAKPLRPRELAKLEHSMQAPVLPTFDGARAAIAASARLDVAAPARNAVAVDGIPVGAGSVAIRVQPGRHHVEVGRRSQWVEASAGAAQTVAATPARRASVRVPQLEQALRQNAGRLRHCARSLAAAGIAEGAFVELELGVNRDGSQGYLNVVRSNVTNQAEDCVFNVVNTFEFPRGPAERIVKKIPFGE